MTPGHYSTGGISLHYTGIGKKKKKKERDLVPEKKKKSKECIYSQITIANRSTLKKKQQCVI
jgi:hypothetical protein